MNGNARETTRRLSSDRPRDRLGRHLPDGSPDARRWPDPEAAVAAGLSPWPAAWTLVGEGHFFEAHELFELLWKSEETEAAARPVMKALAQVCVGLCHLQRDNARGAAALLERGRAGLLAHGSAARGGRVAGGHRLDAGELEALAAWAGDLCEAARGPAPAGAVLDRGRHPPVATGAERLRRPVASRGILYMVLAAVFFSVMSLFVKLAGERLPASQIVLARSVVTLVISWLMLARAGVSPWGRRRGLLFLRGLFGFTALFCFYYAIIHLPLAEATVIQYTNPVFTAVLAALLIGEAMTRRGVVCLLLGLAGVIVVARPAALLGIGGEGLPPAAVGIALVGAFLSGLVYVIVRKLGESEHPLVIVLWFPLVALPAILPVVIPAWTAPTPVEWLYLLGVGVAAQIAQVFMTRGLTLERAGPATTVSYLQIVFAASWGLMIFGEVPDVWTFTGAALIVAAALLLRRRALPADPAAQAATEQKAS